MTPNVFGKVFFSLRNPTLIISKISRYQRIRVNPTGTQLAVESSDCTFATKVGNKVRYATAGDCYSKSTEDCRKGVFKINLQGTGIKLAGSPKWKSQGYPHDDQRITQFQMTEDKVSAHCGGSCSVCEPEAALHLQPKMCIAEAPSDKKKKQKRTKRSAWSWWPW